MGVLTGVTVASERSGFSGKGYITGLTKEGFRSVIKFSAKEGLYRMVLRVAYSGR